MRKYEIMYIIRPTAEEDARKNVITKFNEVFTTRGCEVTNVNEWGMRELAYEIEKFRKGYYVVLNVKANNDALDEFNRLINIDEDVIRYIVVKDEK